MRWTDLPPDRDPADGRGAALTRGQWEDLKERLERLPPGHPSRPDQAGETGEERLAGEDAADQRVPDGDDPAGAGGVQDDRPGRGRAPGDRPEPGRRQAHDAARSVPPGSREPYRPWFTAGGPPEPWLAAGEAPEPWFAADPPE